MRTGKIVAAVFGSLAAIVAFGLIVGGVVLSWAFATQRDADGFITSPEFSLESDGYAITTDEIDLAARPGDWFPSGLADVRVRIDDADVPVFIGIGPSDDVAAYLSGVARDELAQLGPRSRDVRYNDVAGDALPVGEPGDQGFWVASIEGRDATLTWEVEAGEWTVVLMNADASAGIEAPITAGARISILLGIGVGLLVAGLMVGTLATLLLVWATRRAPEEVAAAEAAPRAVSPELGAYPVLIEGRIDEGLSRWLWLVKWLLAIPHFIVLCFLWIAFVLLTIAAFFGILFTGRYPRGIFDFNVGVMRWSWRVAFYSFSAAGTDLYPPFTLADVEYPARFDVAYPERLSRGLVLVKWWLLAIPHYLIVGLFTSGLVWWSTDLGEGDTFLEVGGGLIGLLVLFAVLALAFTGRYPPRLFDLIMGLNRWVYRVGAYASLMRDEYPPFRLDLGGEEVGVESAAPPPAPVGAGGDTPLE